MEDCSNDLLEAIDSFAEAALGDNYFSQPNERNDREFERRVQKELFATANAAASLVDHARRVDKILTMPEYAARRLEAFGADGLHEFVIGLRVLLHHLHVVEAGWNLTHSFEDGKKTVSCCRFDGHPVKLIPPCVRTQQG